MSQRERVSPRDLYAEFADQRTRYTDDTACRKALAIKYGYPLSSVRRMVNEGKLKAQNERLQAEVSALRNEKIIDLFPNMDDTPRFLDLLASIRQRGGYGRALCWYDVHIPDDNEQAIELAIQLEKLVKPDFNLFGGDIYDFDLLSQYVVARKRPRRDPIEEVEDRWLQINRRLSAPSAAFFGNHDSPTAGRMQNFLDTVAGVFADRTERDFVDMVRAGGRVMYLGGMNEVKLHSLYAHHGERTGENAHKNALKDLGFGLSTIQGHTHQPALYIMKQYLPGSDEDYRVIMSAVTGMLGNTRPAYRRGNTPTKYIHSMAVVNFSLTTWIADIQLIVFHRAPNGDLVAFYGGHVLTQTATAASGERADAA